jgi:hypothetical protein
LNFLFLYDSVLVVCMCIETYPFLLGHPICWHIIIHSLLYLFLSLSLSFSLSSSSSSTSFLSSSSPSPSFFVLPLSFSVSLSLSFCFWDGVLLRLLSLVLSSLYITLTEIFCGHQLGPLDLWCHLVLGFLCWFFLWMTYLCIGDRGRGFKVSH